MDIREARRAAGMTQTELANAAKVAQPNLSAYENNRRDPSPAVLLRIRHELEVRPSVRVAQHRERIHEIVARHHAKKPRVIGSVARGEDRPGSDLDLVVDFTDDASLLDEVGLRIALSDLLGVPVDIIAADTLRGEFRERAVRESVPL